MSAPPVAPRRLEGANQAGAWPAAEKVSRDAPTPTPARVRPTVAFQRGREAAALLLFTGAVFTVLALLSFQGHPLDPSIHGPDWVGPVGESWARLIVSSVGVTAWFVPFELLLLVWPLLKNRASVATIARIAGDTLVVLIGASLVHVASPHSAAFGAMPMAGSLGELFGEIMRSLFSTAGSFLIGLSAIGLILIGRASFSFIAWAQKATRGTEVAASKAASGARAVAEAWEKASDLRKKTEAKQASLQGASVLEDPSVDPALFSVSEDEPQAAAGPALPAAPVTTSPVTTALAKRVEPEPLRVDVTPSSPIVAQRSRRSARSDRAEPVSAGPVQAVAPQQSGAVVASVVAERVAPRVAAQSDRVVDKNTKERASAARPDEPGVAAPAVAISPLVVDGVVAGGSVSAPSTGVSPGQASPGRRSRKKKNAEQDEAGDAGEPDDVIVGVLEPRITSVRPEPRIDPRIDPRIVDDVPVESPFELDRTSPPAPGVITIHDPVDVKSTREEPKPSREEPRVAVREEARAVVREEPKPRREEARKEEPRREDTRREEPRRDEPRREEVRVAREEVKVVREETKPSAQTLAIL
ncbi:MAG: DNA translocase FtsK 4TM domain-containing protein, partial [Polyangiaceae bacterium]